MLSENEPCVRNSMPDCSNLEKDTCYVAKPWCCPNKYYCQRSPVVGLYCNGFLNCLNIRVSVRDLVLIKSKDILLAKPSVS